MLAELYFRRRQQEGCASRSVEAPPSVPPQRSDYPPMFDDDESRKSTAQEEFSAGQSNIQRSPERRQHGIFSSGLPTEQSHVSSRSHVTSGESFDMRHQYDSPFESATPQERTPSRPDVGSRPSPPRSSTNWDGTPIVGSRNPYSAPAAVERAPTARVLRFSTKETHGVANSIRKALQETLNEKSTSPPAALTDEYLLVKRRLFLETLFTDDRGCLLPARFDMSHSGDALCAGVEEAFGHSYDKVMKSLSDLWDRLQ